VKLKDSARELGLRQKIATEILWWWFINAHPFQALCEKGGSFPIVVDDISPDRFREPAVTIIKNDFRSGIYPALVPEHQPGRKGRAVGVRIPLLSADFSRASCGVGTIK
jgi:hypothetical protein